MTIDKNKRVKVINRSGGALGYHIPSMRITRRWNQPGDYLNISIEELLELKTVPGGVAVLEDCLLIEDKTALSVLFPDQEIEPEYEYGLEEVSTLLYESGIDQFLDALDYAPKGVLELLKEKAVAKLPDTVEKIKSMNEKFGIDLNKMHELHLERGVEEKAEKTVVKRRRTAPLKKEEEESNQSTLPKYNVVSKEE